MNGGRNKIGIAWKSVLTLGLLAFWVWAIFLSYREAKLKKLNAFVPRSYDYLIKISLNEAPLNKARLEEYEYYYQLLTNIVPRADGYGMLGYCRYYLGKPREATAAYRKALTMNPRFFAAHYNLGVIYISQSQYPLAVESLKKAIALDPKETLTFLLSSKVLRPIIQENDGSPVDIESHIREGYESAYQLLNAMARPGEARLNAFRLF